MTAASPGFSGFEIRPASITVCAPLNSEIHPARVAPFLGVVIILACVLTSDLAVAQSLTFGGNAQHTAVFDVPAQPLNAAHWTTSVDLNNTGAFAHYGAPLVTGSNTVIVPVRITNGFRISAFEGATGRLKYTLSTDYRLPTHNWIPTYQPVLATNPSGLRLYYPGAGGTVYYVDNPDSDTPGAPVQVCFYTSLTNYYTNMTAFTNRVFLNTPLTADTNGTIFFGFRIATNGAPAPLNTTNGGYARVDAADNATYVLASVAANDATTTRDSHNCAPALSLDGQTVYVAVKHLSSAFGAYLLGLDSATLVTKFKVRLRDPRNSNNAGIPDDGTASPMVAPDGDVFFGVLASPGNGSRGFLLHFNADLTVSKPPGAFGWDFTPAIVPTNMVPDYTGPSPYLLFSKYNNYAAAGDADGVNRIALLDPNATQVDPHPSANGLLVMREVKTVIAPTPDVEHIGTTYPYAVREWCINTAVVNPPTYSVFSPCEDGRLYRWNLASHSLSETFRLGLGLGQPYVPAVVGPDGTVFTLNGGTLFAIGGLTNVAVSVHSSSPDLESVVAGQSTSFTAVVTNLDGAGPVPTGTVTFQDVTYQGVSPVTNLLASGVPLTNGVASVTTSTLIAASNFLGSHFITATYSGDTNFPGGAATLAQKVHAYAGALTLTSAGPAPGTNAVTFTATVVSGSPATNKPTGMVTLYDRATFLAQRALNTNGIAAFTITNLATGSHAINARYASDTIFAASTGAVAGVACNLDAVPGSGGAVQFSFTNVSGAPFVMLTATNLDLPLAQWTEAGAVTEFFPGQFQFTDYPGTNAGVLFYRVRSP